MKSILFFVLSMLCCQAWAQSVGFHQQVIDQQSARPLAITIWYPTEQTQDIEHVGENLVFYGIPVIKDAAPGSEPLATILLSHGYRGSWRNLNWLAFELARDGYLVAAVDHPGTTTFDHDPQQAAQWWQRPRDLSRLLDWLMINLQGGVVDGQRIAAIGHSQGGWTVMNLIGARFDRGLFNLDCQQHPDAVTCGLASELGLDVKQPGEAVGSLRDERIKAAVTLDLGLARGFSSDSLAALQVPSLILAAGVNIANLPYQMESGFLASHIPSSKRQYRVFPEATHFSFMQLCKPGAQAIIEQEEPGDGIVCQDGGSRSRVELHADMYGEIHTFLQQTLHD